ncbi:MAG: hypothetical protein IKR30_01975 [Bacteroidales bacterium]|nr:hypothetical protein [Bacteroidales bacterium]
MKKYIIILAAFFAAALLATGCEPEGNDLKTKAQGLTISLASGELETKAGEPFAFEKAIEHFDFFFFKDAAGTEPIRGMHARVTGNSTTLDTSENGDYSALRKGTSYVYILANYPGTISHTNDWTLAQLLALEVDDPIVTAKETKLNPITGDMEETGKVTFCTSLVMDSYQKATDTTAETYTTKLTPQAIEEERTVTIKLSRLASKLSLIIDVEPTVPGSMTYTDAGGTVHQEVWTPVLKDLHAYFVNALNNKATVSAEPIVRATIQADPDSYDYLTYPTLYPLTRDASDDHKFTSAPAYTYPQEWADTANGEPYFKIQIPWESSLRGSTTFYYKVALPKSESNKRTISRNMHYQVTVDLSVVDTENEYVELNGSYVVTPWLASGWDGGNDVKPAKFFSVPVTTYEIYSQDELSIPFYSSSAVSAYFEEISFVYYGNRTKPTYNYPFGNVGDDQAGPLTTSPYDGSTLPTAAQDLNIYQLEVVGRNVNFTHALTNVFTERIIKVTIKNQDGASETVTIHQHPSIEVQTMNTKTIFVNGHFSRATENVHVNGGSNAKMGVRWGPMKYLSDAGQYRYHSDDSSISNYWTFGSWNSPTYNGAESTCARIMPNPTKGIYGSIEGDWKFLDEEPFMTIIAVSAFNATNSKYVYKDNNGVEHENTFRLGDPRVKGNLSLADYLYQSTTVRTESGTTTGNAVYKSWDNPDDVLVSSTNTNDRGLIAPRFLLSSALNCMTDGGNTFANAQKRAATYQEAGYPAGRWRLPTEAEIMFMISRQNEGVIPSVWGSTNYWCADGRVVSRHSDGTTYFTTATSAYNRFVYDLWYWGDTPMSDTETYWPNKHEH